MKYKASITIYTGGYYFSPKMKSNVTRIFNIDVSLFFKVFVVIA